MHPSHSLSRRLLLRFAAGAAAGTTLTAVLSACGSSAATDIPKPAATLPPPIGNTSVPATAATVAPTTVAIATTATTVPTNSKAVEITTTSFYAGETHPYNVLVKQYNDKQRGVKVTHQVEADYPTVVQKLQAGLAAGKPISVVTIPWNYRLYAATALGLVPVDELGIGDAKDIYARYKPEVLSSAQVDGKTLGLPFATSLPVAFMNNDIIAAAGLDVKNPPKMWDEMKSWVQTIKAKTGKNPYAGYANSWIAQTFIESAGGRVLDDKYKPVMDDPNAVAGLNVWRSMFENSLSQWTTYSEAVAGFTAGNTGLMVESIYNLSNYQKNAKFAFTTVPYPAFSGKTPRLPVGGNFLAIFAKDKDQRKAAWDFLSFMTSDEAMKTWVTSGYLSPTNAKVDVTPGQEAAYAELGFAVPWQAWPGNRGVEAEKSFTDWVTKGVSGETTAQEAMAKAKADIAPLLP